MKTTLHFIKGNYLSSCRRLIVCAMDVMIIFCVSVGLLLAGPIANKTGISFDVMKDLIHLMVCIFLFLILFKTYDSLWRYAESREYLMLVAAVFCGVGFFWILSQFAFTRNLPGYYILSAASSSLLVMFLARFSYRSYRAHKMNQVERQSGEKKRRTVVIGAGDAGALLLKEMQTYPDNPCEIVCFVDDDSIKKGRKLLGVPVKGPIENLPQIVASCGASEILFAIPSCGAKRKKEILQLCTQTNCRIRVLPGQMGILGNRRESLMIQMRNVQVEDLLGREAVTIQNERIRGLLQGKVVLVTGGGGSIGSELCRQIITNHPDRLIIFDCYENNAYEVQQELKTLLPKETELFIEIGSVRDLKKIDFLFRKYHPDLVFHAAAHKHVPLMENNPEEAVKNNIFGTYFLSRTAVKYRVDKFVLISTDKAVNPTNAMGASKRFCEMILQSMNGFTKTDFVAVRFGNVLGSNGSVIPLFRRQIENGGPVTITDKRIIRYFMTIPEAAQLVLEAGAMARKSEVFVLDMGEPVRILDLAENLIRLSGFVPYQEIQIVETGLRPGEKLYEELLTKGNNLARTENQKIFIEEQEDIPLKKIEEAILRLQKTIEASDYTGVRMILHELVPTFRESEDVNREAVLYAEHHGGLKKTAAEATISISLDDVEAALEHDAGYGMSH